MLKRIAAILAVTTVLGVCLAAPAPVSACPNCKQAHTAPDDADADYKASIAARPKAYMYSILFMLGMPMTLVSAFGFSFYRMVKNAEAAQALGETKVTLLEGEGQTVVDPE